jgi:hypothetical protein
MKCQACGVEKQDHAQLWTKGVGWHGWIEPDKKTIAERLRQRYGLV